LAGRTWVPARSHSVGGSLAPSGATCAQIQICKPTLPEHGAIASQAGDGDRERLLQTSKTGEGRAPVRSGQLEPGDGGTAAVPADDPPGEGVGLGRPGDSQLITSRPNNAEGIPTRACGTAPGGAGSAWMPVTAGCWRTAHAEASDPSGLRARCRLSALPPQAPPGRCVGDGRDQTEMTTLTSRAWGPFGPSSTSYSTFATSARLLKPAAAGSRSSGGSLLASASSNGAGARRDGANPSPRRRRGRTRRLGSPGSRSNCACAMSLPPSDRLGIFRGRRPVSASVSKPS
jgi:hypothetical protein